MSPDRVFRALIFFGAASLAALSGAEAGAFREPPGTGEIITSASFSGSTRSFDASGKLIPVRSYSKFELGTYIDYGLTDWLTLVATPSLDHIHTQAADGHSETATGLGDTGLGARAGFYPTPDLVFSVQGLLRPPLALQPNPTAQWFEHSHIWSGELRGLAGTSLEIAGFAAFANVEAGYRWNGTMTANEWRADLTFGLHATPRVLILLQTFAAISDGRTESNPSYYWDKGQISGVYAFDAAWSAQIGCFATLAGRNAAREIGPFTALWYRF